MNNQSPLKFTDFDSITGDPHLQMLKAAMPYVDASRQRTFSILIRLQELRKTLSLFDEEHAAVGICSLDESQPRSPLDMLRAIKPYGSPQEQDFINLICGFFQNGRQENQLKDTPVQSMQLPDTYMEIPDAEIPNSRIQDAGAQQIRPFLSAEQQTRLDTAFLLIQAMQQMT